MLQELILENDEPFKLRVEEAVSAIQELLDERWPGTYTIKRG